MAFRTKFHLGVTFFGVATYFSQFRLKEANYYGSGFNSKLFFNLEHKKLGNLDISVLGYTLWSFPGIVDVTRGSVYWLFTDITYSYNIFRNMSLGITNSFALEQARVRNNSADYTSNTRKTHHALKFFVAWDF
jgi:hypothetical protein